MVERPSNWPFTEALDQEAIVKRARILMSQGKTKSAAIAIALSQRTTEPFTKELILQAQTNQRTEESLALNSYGILLADIRNINDPTTKEGSIDEELKAMMRKFPALERDLLKVNPQQQRWIELLKSDETGLELAKEIVWQSVLENTPENSQFEQLPANQVITSIGDLLKPEIEKSLPPRFRGRVQCLRDYQQILKLLN